MLMSHALWGPRLRRAGTVRSPQNKTHLLLFLDRGVCFSLFRSLQNNANFRLYWTGSFVSNFGTWMQSVAQGYLVYQLTGSTFMLGMVGFAQSIPFLFLALFGGVLADRME